MDHHHPLDAGHPGQRVGAGRGVLGDDVDAAERAGAARFDVDPHVRQQLYRAAALVAQRVGRHVAAAHAAAVAARHGQVDRLAGAHRRRGRERRVGVRQEGFLEQLGPADAGEDDDRQTAPIACVPEGRKSS